jgi:hypothetical protein
LAIPWREAPIGLSTVARGMAAGHEARRPAPAEIACRKTILLDDKVFFWEGLCWQAIPPDPKPLTPRKGWVFP